MIDLCEGTVQNNFQTLSYPGSVTSYKNEILIFSENCSKTKLKFGKCYRECTEHPYSFRL